jgi:hypothetical protein
MGDDPLRHIGREGVVMYASVTPDVRPTGRARHILPSGVTGSASALVIWHDRDDTGGYFLFGLDTDAQVETDTWHMSVDEAVAQADSEYSGLVWVEVSA